MGPDMKKPLALVIRKQLSKYLTGGTTLESFEEWFVPNALTAVEESGDPEAEALTYGIELRLAEFSDGGWTEDELRGLLRKEFATSERPRTLSRESAR